MAQVCPFKAVIYNQEKIKDLSRVVCPPYDIISQAQQQHYHSLNPHNFIRIILGKEIPGEDKYRRSGELFEKWLKEGILVRESSPAFYFYSQQYDLQREKKIRLGFIGLMHLGHGSSSAFGHEHTRLEPKEDRLKLIRQVKANLSPIFVIYNDSQRAIQTTYQHYVIGKAPLINITDEQGVIHKLWRVQDPEAVEKIRQKMLDERMFIADGHHRYEVACNYLQETKAKRKVEEHESINYILTYFTNTQSHGLNIMPIHRLVKLPEKSNWQEIVNQIGEYFTVDEVAQKQRFFFLTKKAGFAEHVIGLYKDKKYSILRLKNPRLLDKLMADKSPGLRKLDVSVLNQIIFKKIMGFESDDHQRLSYIQDPEELIRSVDGNQAYAGFFLNPVKVEQIMAVALNQERMPPKSTYFYPKVLSGLVISKHE